MESDKVSSFGRALRARRLVASLSQEALAERAGISADAVAALERGRRRRPRLHTARALADGLGLDDRARAQLLSTLDLAAESMESLPADLHPVLGREVEIDAVLDLFARQFRVVTLTGPGGVGKTRLASAVAARLVESRTEVHWIRLAAVTDAGTLAATVSAALGARQVAGSALSDSLADRLGMSAVVVFDNCEQVVTAVAHLCAELVGRTRGVRVLATSRELLRVPGEIVWPVTPLRVPGEATGPAELGEWPSVQLFVDRAREVVPEFAADHQTVATIAQVCRRLDGLPLAIELAAAQMNALTPAQLSHELEGSIHIVSGGPQTLPNRYRTLEGAISWSYDLLDDAEQKLLARLATASGGWTLEAAQSFAAGDGLPADAVLGIITGLVGKSLVKLDVRRGQGRYGMLRVIRLYAVGRLDTSGEADTVRARHARYYSQLADRAAAALRGPGQSGWLRRLDADTDNIRTAFRYWCEQDEVAAALRLAVALWRFWYLRGHYAEGRRVLDEALRLAAANGEGDPMLTGRALVALGTLAYLQCEYDSAAESITAGLALFRTIDPDSIAIADALQRRASIARERGEYEAATAMLQDSLARWRAAGDTLGVGEALNYLAFVAWLTCQYSDAERLAHSALDQIHGVDAGEGWVWALLNRGVSARYRGAVDDAERLLRAGLDRAEEIGYSEGTAWCLDQLGALGRMHGDLQLAWDLQHESLARHVQLGDRWRCASVLEGLAATALALSRPSTATRMLRVAEAVRAAIGTPRPPCERPEYDVVVARLGAELGTAEYARLISRPPRYRLLAWLARADSLDAVETLLSADDAEPQRPAESTHSSWF